MFNPIDLSTIPTEQLEKELQLRQNSFTIIQKLDTGERSTITFSGLQGRFSVSYHSTMIYLSDQMMKDLADWINAQLNRKATPEPIARKVIMGTDIFDEQ